MESGHYPPLRRPNARCRLGKPPASLAGTLSERQRKGPVSGAFTSSGGRI
jgi:hypothetical protein